MLNIGTKVFRNLQEQVGYNTKCIKELDEVLDGLVIEDHLVVIGDPSGTISEADLNILQGNLAFMYYDGAVYVKTSETLTEITFKKCEIVATEVGGTYYNIGMSKIVVTISTKAYLVSTDNIISTYSKSQLDGIVTTLNTAISAKLNSADLLDKTYPVGAIYYSSSNTSPAGALGGTWSSLGAHYIPKGKVPVVSGANHLSNVGTSIEGMVMSSPSGNLLTTEYALRTNAVTQGVFAYRDNQTLAGDSYLTPANLYSDNTDTGSNTVVYLFERIA